MSAAELRAAADKLRELAEDATPGPWRLGTDRYADLVANREHPERIGGGWEWNDSYGGCLVAESMMRPDREYAAAVNPLVGLALADLLDSLADDAEQSIDDRAAYGAPPRDELVLARLINRGAS